MKFIQKWIWLFFKEQNTWPRIAFLEKKKAFAWHKKEMQTGMLKAFPLDCGVYDWALKDGILSNEETEKDTPEFIAEYRCDSQETYFFRSLDYPDKTIDELKPFKNRCLMCRKKLTEKPYVLTGRAEKTFSQGIIFGAFLSCFWHGPRDMYVTQGIVPDSSRMNNFGFSFCSLKCLQDYFNRCMDLLEEDIQKVIKAPPEHYWKYDAKGKLRKYKGYPRVSKETDQKIASLWIFRKGNRFYPSGVFSSKTKLEKWIENNRLKGMISEVEVGKEQPTGRESIPEKLRLSRVQFPMLKNESENMRDIKKCAICYNQNSSCGTGLTGGAFYSKDVKKLSGGPSSYMTGFFEILKLSDSPFVLKIAEEVPQGQFEIFFCSVHCLRNFLQACVEKCRRLEKKNISAKGNERGYV